MARISICIFFSNPRIWTQAWGSLTSSKSQIHSQHCRQRAGQQTDLVCKSCWERNAAESPTSSKKTSVQGPFADPFAPKPRLDGPKNPSSFPGFERVSPGSWIFKYFGSFRWVVLKDFPGFHFSFTSFLFGVLNCAVHYNSSDLISSFHVFSKLGRPAWSIVNTTPLSGPRRKMPTTATRSPNERPHCRSDI